MERRDGYMRPSGNMDTDFDGSSRKPPGGAKILAAVMGGSLLLVAAGVAAALTLGVITFKHANKDGIGHRVCNTGSNLDAFLPWCPVNGTEIGVQMVAGNRSLTETSVVKRIVGRFGVNATSLNETLVALDANIASLSPEIVLTQGTELGDPLTITFVPSPTPGSAGDPCDVSCEEDYQLSIVNGDDGYGIVMGNNITFSPSATNENSAAFGGANNSVINSPEAFLLGGIRSTIEDAAGSGIIAATDSTVNVTRSFAAACINCNVHNTDSSMSFSSGSTISGGGSYHHIIFATDSSITTSNDYGLIIGGFDNDISGSMFSGAIISSIESTIEGSFDSVNAVISCVRSISRFNLGTVLLGTGDIEVNGVDGSVVVGRDLPSTITGARYANSLIAKNLAGFGSLAVAGFVDLAGGSPFIDPGEYIYLGGTVTTTLGLAQPSLVPDGFIFIVKDKGDLSSFPVTLSCAIYSCIICPKDTACTAAGGTYVINTQYASETFHYRASTATYYGV